MILFSEESDTLHIQLYKELLFMSCHLVLWRMASTAALLTI